MGFRYLDNEDAFWELAALNAKVTSPEYIEEFMRSERINRNVTMIDRETNMLIEYDGFGNRTETHFGERLAAVTDSNVAVIPDEIPLSAMAVATEVEIFAEEAEQEIFNVTNSFNTGWVWTWVPQGWPGTHGTLVGGSYRITSWNTTWVVLGTQSLSTPTIDAWITNAIGDCRHWYINIGSWWEAWHQVSFPGEHYGAHVTSVWWYSWEQLRFFTFPAQQQTTPPVITTPNSDWQTLPVSGFTFWWNSVPGATSYTVSLLNLTTGQQTLHPWSTTSTGVTFGQGWFTGGHQYRFSVSSRVGSVDSALSHRFFVVQQDPFFAFYGELGWRYPLDHPDSRFISSGYRTPRHDHYGIDIVRLNPATGGQSPGAIMGEAVFAAHGGTVILSGWHSTAGWRVGIRSTVRDPASWNWIVSRYQHLRFQPLVNMDTTINQGTQIGNVGNSGVESSSSGHLHLDFNNANLPTGVGDYAINPQRFFPHISFRGVTSNATP